MWLDVGKEWRGMKVIEGMMRMRGLGVGDHGKEEEKEIEKEVEEEGMGVVEG